MCSDSYSTLQMLFGFNLAKTECKMHFLYSAAEIK